MTKVTLHFDLLRPLTDADYTSIGDLPSVYGMVRVVPTSPTQLTVDYDASRLTPKDVQSTLARFGMPLKTLVHA